jgi:hypothetical protein
MERINRSVTISESLLFMGIATTNPTPATPTVSRERLAWMVLLISFSVCAILSFAIPYSIVSYVNGSSVSRIATGQGTSGTALIERPDLPGDALVRINSGEARDITEGSVIRTDNTTQLLVEFFDGSTLTIFPDSVVILSEMRQPSFPGYTAQPDRIVLRVTDGRVRVQVAPTPERVRHFEIQTPHAPSPQGGIVLEGGSYAIETATDMTHVSVRSGTAVVKGQTGNPVSVTDNERAEIPLGAAAGGPFPTQRNLLANPNFDRLESSVPISAGPLAQGWFVVSEQGGDGGTVDGTVEVDTSGVSRALHFMRQGSGNNHGETSVVQQVDKLVGDYSLVQLRFDVRIVSQSLSGGGLLSSEFPLIVRVDYQDQYGNPQYWTQGFYCQNTAGYNIVGGVEVPCGTRRNIEIALNAIPNAPTALTSIEFYASGWDWDVYVSDVEITVE